MLGAAGGTLNDGPQLPHQQAGIMVTGGILLREIVIVIMSKIEMRAFVKVKSHIIKLISST